MVNNFEIFVGTHRTAAIVFFLADDVNFLRVERVGIPHDGANIKIVFDVFDGDFEVVSGFFEGVKNLLVCHTFVLIDEVTGVFHVSLL